MLNTSNYRMSRTLTVQDTLGGEEHHHGQRRRKNDVLSGIQVGKRCRNLGRRFLV